MDRDWMLQLNETRQSYVNETWIPLRANIEDVKNSNKQYNEVGYVHEIFQCGSVAFPPQHRELAEALDWNSLGLPNKASPNAYEDGYYSPIDQYQFEDKKPGGVELVFVHEHPVGEKWILNPDLVVALRLVRDGHKWVRPEENYVEVAREVLDSDGQYRSIEIKREFLIDYLAARGLSLRLSYYRERVEAVASIDGSDYEELKPLVCNRDDGEFQLFIGSFQAGPKPIWVRSRFWKNEWIDHHGQSVRVRGDKVPTPDR